MKPLHWVKDNRVLSPNFGMMLGWLMVGVIGWVFGWRNSIAAVYVLSICALAETSRAAWAAERKVAKDRKRDEGE